MLSTALRVRRAVMRTNQTQAAKEIGAGESTYRKWEHGEGIDGITVRRATDLARFLGTELGDVFEMILEETRS